MPPCPGLKLGSSAARWAGRVRAPAPGRLARGPAGRARRVRARRARAGGAGGSPCGPLYHSGRTFVSPARWAARNARRRASMNESSPAGQRVSGGEDRGSPPPSAGPRRRLLPTRAAVSMHLFDRSFTPEMDDTEQRASSRTTGRGGVPCSGENARAWLRGVLTFRGDHLLGFVGGRGFRGTVGAVAEPLDLGDGLGGHEDAAP